MALPYDTDESRERAVQFLRQAQAQIHAARAELGSDGFDSSAPDELAALPTVAYDIDILVRSLQRRWSTDERGYFERVGEMSDRTSDLMAVDHFRGLNAEAIGMKILPPGAGRPDADEEDEAD